MKKRLIISVIFMSLLLVGCSDSKKNTQKPKIKTPYSALIKDKSSSAKVNSLNPQDGTYSEPTENNEIIISSANITETQNTLKPQSSPITDFEYKTNNYGDITITKYIGQDSVVVIPSEINGKSVSELDHKVFNDCAEITDITIPDSVLTIGIFVFSGCDKLQNINVDSDNINFSSKDGVLFDKDGSFLIQFPCGRSGGYTIPSGTETVGRWAFQECNRLLSVTIPDSVTTLDDGAFYKCSRLKSVKGGKNISKIPSGAFGHCKSLSEIDLSDNLKSIDFDAFTDCENLIRVTFPDSLSQMGARAIDGCTKIHVTYKGKTYDYFEREQLRKAVNGEQNVYSSSRQSTNSRPQNSTSVQSSFQPVQDSTKAINELNQAIAIYRYEISAYQDAINKANDLVSDFKRLQGECENKLKSAEVDLANAYKKKTYVFDGSEFKQVTDQAAVKKAQENVDYYKTQAERCRINKEETEKLIEKYTAEISAKEAQIAICQSAIAELS